MPARFSQLNPFARNLPVAAIALAAATGFIPLAQGKPSTPGVWVTGQALEINGQKEIPRGLFGVHSMKLTDAEVERWGIESTRLIHPAGTEHPSSPGSNGELPAKLSSVVDCMFDRYIPALQLTERDWEKRLTQLARNYGTAARQTKQTQYVEFWNEPYLNWAAKPGVNYAASQYRTEGIKAGDPMILKTTGQPVPGLVWDREIFYVRNENGSDLDYVLSGYIPRTAVDGELTTLGYGAGQARLVDGGKVRLRGKEFVVSKAWSGRDPEQKYYWSGPVNERLYNEMFSVFGRVLKETNPDVRLAAGWGFNFYNENWEAWERLIKPTIDKNHDWIDALHEHHYGGDTRLVAASYEVAYAYTLAHYQRRLQFWNTEAGGQLDPQQPGNAIPNAQGSPAARATGGMTYILRDISFLLDRLPDKAILRAAHQPQDNGGDLPSFELLKPLRGRLMAVETNLPAVWSAASIEERRLTVLVFNDAIEARDIPITIQAPSGTSLTGVTERRLILESAAPWLRLAEQPGSASGESWSAKPNIPGKSAVVLVFDLNGVPALKETVYRQQFVSGDILLPLTQGVETDILLPTPVEPSGNNILRLVVSNPGANYTIVLNDQILSAPSSDSQIWDIALPPGILKEKNHLRLTSADGKGQLLAASIYLEKRSP